MSITTICSGMDAKQVVGYSTTKMAVSSESGQKTVQKQTTITVWSLEEEWQSSLYDIKEIISVSLVNSASVSYINKNQHKLGISYIG